MSVANNLLSGIILGPITFLLGAISLTSLNRLTEYVHLTSKNSSLRGWEREYLKPLCKNLDVIFERIGVTKITITPTNILLMAVVILLFALLLTLAEKGEKEKKASKEKEKEKRG